MPTTHLPKQSALATRAAGLETKDRVGNSSRRNPIRIDILNAPMQISDTRRWSIVGLLFAAGFVNYLDRAILSVALPRIAGDLGLGPEAKGVLLSAFFWSYAVMQLPMGWLSDRVNMRWFYAGAFALWSLSCGFTGFATTLGTLLALRVLLGVGEAIYLPGGIRIVNLLLAPGQQGLASGLVNSGTRLGLALGAPLVAWMVVGAGWHNAFFLAGFAGLIWLVPWFLTCPPHLGSTPPPAAPAPSGRPRWLNRNLLGLCLGHIGFSYYWYLFVTWLPDYLVESRKIPLAQAGLYAMIPYLVFSIAEPGGGWGGGPSDPPRLGRIPHAKGNHHLRVF